jgi:hypothetical protein
MQYLLMTAMAEQAYAALPPDVVEENMAAYEKFGAEMGERGVLLGGARLRPTTDATCVQVRDGKVITADGPFAETKEQLGGYYLVDVADLDEALEVAAKIPGAAHGTIEVRPIWSM